MKVPKIILNIPFDTRWMRRKTFNECPWNSHKMKRKRTRNNAYISVMIMSSTITWLKPLPIRNKNPVKEPKVCRHYQFVYYYFYQIILSHSIQAHFSLYSLTNKKKIGDSSFHCIFSNCFFVNWKKLWPIRHPSRYPTVPPYITSLYFWQKTVLFQLSPSFSVIYQSDVI